MNAVWNSYGQLCGCPEIFKKSCKFFCRELDIRVSQVMHPDSLYPRSFRSSVHLVVEIRFGNCENPFVLFRLIQHFQIILHLITQKLRHLNGSITF